MIWFKWHLNTSSMTPFLLGFVVLLSNYYSLGSKTCLPQGHLTPLRFYKAPVKPSLNIGLYLLSIFTVVAHRTISSSGSWPCPFFVLPHFHRFQLNLKKEFLGIAWQSLSSPRSGILTRETVQLNCSDGPDYDTSPTLWLWLALTMYIAVIQPNVRQSHLWTLNLSPLCHCEELRKLFHVIIRHRL